MRAIAAVDLNWGIGCKGDLLQRIPEDMKYFKQHTLGKVVIMGRKTFESLPDKKPLRDRKNIVLSRDVDFKNDSVTICHSLEELFQELKVYKSTDVYVIGGESVYTQLLPYCTEVYVTKIESTYAADKYLTNLDSEKTWKLIGESDKKNYKDIQFRFLKYQIEL